MLTYAPPPDKSITLRALLLGAVAEGRTVIDNPLFCDDTRAAVACLRRLGIRLRLSARRIIVQGRGLRGLRPPRRALDARGCAALCRMLAGLLAGQAFPSAITGGASLRRRPMERVAEPIRRMGGQVRTCRGGPPIRISPAPLRGIKHRLAIPSAQVKSAVLLAGLYARGTTSVEEPLLSRDHTERLLRHFGAKLLRRGRKWIIRPGELKGRRLRVPGDFSSAAPFLTAALISGRGLRIKGVGVNPTRLGLIRTLRRMGADIQVAPRRGFPEPWGDIRVRPSRLKACAVEAAEIPSLIDEIPLLMVAAASARGRSTIRGAGELRHKESDRIRSALRLLKALGARASCRGGTLEVMGPCAFRGGRVSGFNDHRMAMAATAAGARSSWPVTIADPACVRKSYPGFFADFRKVFG